MKLEFNKRSTIKEKNQKTGIIFRVKENKHKQVVKMNAGC
jgi:hypothetical protein